MKNNLLKQLMVVVLFVSSVLFASPLAYGKTVDIQQSIDAVKMELKKAPMYFVEPALDGIVTPSSTLYPVLNSAKKNYQELRKIILASNLSEIEKQSKLKEIDALYTEKITKGVIPYIDASNYATKYLEPLLNDIKIAEANNDFAAVEIAYHKLSFQLKSRTSILHRFTGKAARDLLLDKYKQPANDKRDELIVPVTIYMKMIEVQKLLNENKKEEAQKIYGSIEALVKMLPNTNSFVLALVKQVENLKPGLGLTTPPSDNGQSGGSSGETSKTKRVSGTIEALTADTVKISGNLYKATSSVKGLFQEKNIEALEGAAITVETVNGVIQKVTSLNLKSSGSSALSAIVDGNGAYIEGSVTVDGDYYELQNLVVNGDLTLTNAVKNSFVTNKLTVNGTVHTSKPVAKQTTFASRMMLAVNPKTTITIVFNDSTVATFEISQEDIYFAATGSTRVTTLSLQANAEIFADPNIIFPKLEIKDGVTRVVLNATIASVVINSNDEIEVLGSGNFDNVEINTDKAVTLNTTGTIKTLDVKNENSNITIGSSLKVGSVTTPNNKPIEDIISNYDDIKDNIGDIGETTEHFAAGILQIPNRFGYIKLNIKNQGDYQVKYLMVDRSKSHQIVLPKIGETVPTDALDYVLNEEFILWAFNDLYVYKTDDKGTIIEIVQPETIWNVPVEFTLVGNQTVLVESIINPSNQSVADWMRHIFVFNGTNMEKVTDFSSVNWVQNDGIYTFSINLTRAVDLNQPGKMYLTSNGVSMYGYPFGSFEYSEVQNVFILYSFAKDPSILPLSEFASALRQFAHDIMESDSVSMAKYREALLADEANLQTPDKIKEMVERVNNELQTNSTKLKQAKALVDSLYKEDRHNYSTLEEQVQAGITQEQVDQAKAAVEDLDNSYTEKTYLLEEIARVQQALENRAIKLDFESLTIPTIDEAGNLVLPTSQNGSAFIWRSDNSFVISDSGEHVGEGTALFLLEIKKGIYSKVVFFNVTADSSTITTITKQE